MVDGDPFSLAGSKLAPPEPKNRCPWLEYRITDALVDEILNRPRKQVSRTTQLAYDLKQARGIVYKIYDITEEDNPSPKPREGETC